MGHGRILVPFSAAVRKQLQHLSISVVNSSVFVFAVMYNTTKTYLKLIIENL